jgi:hypothetical protein
VRIVRRLRTSPVKRLVKITAGVVLAAISCVVGITAVIEFLSWRSERQVTAIVSDLAPGSPFSAAVARLGQPTRTITDVDEMRVFNRQGEKRAIPDSILYLFVHRGPPYRWVLVYTDRASQQIQHAEWQQM